MCNTNKNMTKMGMIIKRVYCNCSSYRTKGDGRAFQLSNSIIFCHLHSSFNIIMNLWWEHLPFKWKLSSKLLLSYRTKGEGRAFQPSKSIIFWHLHSLFKHRHELVFSPHANPNGKNEIFMLAVLVSTVVSITFGDQEWPTNWPNWNQSEELTLPSTGKNCILTTNYLISSQTWARFISILWVWWTSDSFMALRIDMNFVFKMIIIVLKIYCQNHSNRLSAFLISPFFSFFSIFDFTKVAPQKN